MADLLELPKTKQGYRYLVVVVDLWSREVDFQQVKDKRAATVRDAMKKVFQRGEGGAAEGAAQLSTDGGAEFKGEFHRWLWGENMTTNRASRTGISNSPP